VLCCAAAKKSTPRLCRPDSLSILGQRCGWAQTMAQTATAGAAPALLAVPVVSAAVRAYPHAVTYILGVQNTAALN